MRPLGVAVLLVVAVAAIAFLWWQRVPDRTNPERSHPPSAHPSVPAPPSAPSAAVPADARQANPGADSITAAGLLGRLKALHQALAAGRKPAEAAALLAALAAELRNAPRDVATTALLMLLDGGSDAPTGLAFKVGAGGQLATAPTFRVWMLDLLGQINGPEGALYAERIYARRDSADEWALALRNDWRAAAPAGRIAEVRRRAVELVDDTRWAKRPSPGYLEGFDFSVLTMAWEAVPRFERLLNSEDNSDLRRAAWIALDRLALEAPADFLPRLAQRTEWLESQPLVRAGLFARADLGSARERSAVEAYLARPGLAAAEAAKFFELIPNINATVSPTLGAAVRVPTLHDAARMDRAALAALPAWQQRPEFARWSAAMAAAATRLQESVAAAARGGFSPP